MNKFKEQICEFAHIMEQKGLCNAVEGNISYLDRVNNLLYVTPSGTRKLTLTEDQVAVIDAETEKQVGGSLKASSEFRLHLGVLNARPDCDSAYHCHAPFLTAFACSGEDIECDFYHEIPAGYDKIPCVPYGTPGTHKIELEASKLLQQPNCNVVLLGNHGVVAVGKDVSDSSKRLEAAEAAAKIVTITKAFHTPKPIPADELEHLHKNFHL